MTADVLDVIAISAATASMTLALLVLLISR